MDWGSFLPLQALLLIWIAFRSHVTASDVCSDIDSDEYYLKLHSTGFPLTYEHNFSGCRGITQSSNYSLVTFYYFDTEPDHDFVAITQEDSSDPWIHSGRSLPINQPLKFENDFTLSFETDDSIAFTGFGVFILPGTYGCGSEEIITLSPSNSVTLTTPNFPNAYPNSHACSWVVGVEPGATVQFMIEVFDLETGFDTLEVSDGYTEHIVSNQTRNVLSSSSFLFFSFSSDHSITRQGFNITLQLSEMNSMNLPDEISGCGDSDSDIIPRVLYSPGYPNNYENSLNECLNVTPSHGYSRITFMDFHTEEGFDFLCIKIGNTLAWYHSGEGIPEGDSRFLISSPFSLGFYTDSSETHTGYALYLQPGSYGCGSNGIIDASTTPRSISSPNFPNNYPNNIACSWVVGVPLDQAIRMTFTAFDLEYDYDFLYISDGSTTAESTGSDVIMTSDSGHVFLTFTSDRTETEQGFNVTLKLVDDTAELDSHAESKESRSSENSGLSLAIVAAITVILVVALLVAGAVLIVYIRHRKPNGNTPTSGNHMSTMPPDSRPRSHNAYVHEGTEKQVIEDEQVKSKEEKPYIELTDTIKGHVNAVCKKDSYRDVYEGEEAYDYIDDKMLGNIKANPIERNSNEHNDGYLDFKRIV